MTWAKINFERKQVNRVLVRCKNGKHDDKRKRILEREERQELRASRQSNDY